MADNDVDGDALTKWDPALTKRLVDVLRPIVNRYFRFEVHDLGRIPATGALLVSNHSGGTVATDIPTFSVAFYDQFGYDRPIYTLSHDILSVGLTKDFFQRAGFIPASRDNAARALAADAVVMVFPGGDHDAMRPTLQQNVIDFKGRTGYVKTAIDAGVPIVPVVSIGGQEDPILPDPGNVVGQATGIETASAQRAVSDLCGLSVRAERRRGQLAATDQDRHASAGANRHRRRVRHQRRRRRRRRTCSGRHADRAEPVGE